MLTTHVPWSLGFVRVAFCTIKGHTRNTLYRARKGIIFYLHDSLPSVPISFRSSSPLPLAWRQGGEEGLQYTSKARREHICVGVPGRASRKACCWEGHGREGRWTDELTHAHTTSFRLYNAICVSLKRRCCELTSHFGAVKTKRRALKQKTCTWSRCRPPGLTVSLAASQTSHCVSVEQDSP